MRHAAGRSAALLAVGAVFCQAKELCRPDSKNCSTIFILGKTLQRSWENATKMAEDMVKNLTQEEMSYLVYGSAWEPNSYGGPNPGTYVGNTRAFPKYGIPALKMGDAGQGYRPQLPFEIGTVTAFPCLLALAATWDEEIVQAVAAAIAREYKGKGANVILGPSVNVHRVARGGRNFEYLSGEDPYLGVRLTKAYVYGGQDEGVMLNAKHWAFNEQETSRMHQDSIVDTRTAWELYYPPFEASVEAGIASYMCSYNKINGTYACENEEILNNVLRKRWGFEGFVMSDWGATHSTTAIRRGLDQDMSGNDFFFTLPNIQEQELSHQFEALKRNETKPVPLLEQASKRILAGMYKVNLDKEPGCDPYAEPKRCWAERYNHTRVKAHDDLNRYAAESSIVLLQNDGILPLNPQMVRTIAVMGPAADHYPIAMDEASWSGPYANAGADFYGGGGSGKVFVKQEGFNTPLGAIYQRARHSGVTLLHGPASLNGSEREVHAMAMSADVVIIVGATTAHEFTDRDHLHMEYWCDSLISFVAKFKPTVVLMQTPGATVTPFRSEVSAIANMFLGGEETGWAWASMLFGDMNPSGKLPVMFPASAQDTIEPWVAEVPYHEGMFTSYRSQKLIAAFPFGHGLSYTSFDYGVAKIQKKGKKSPKGTVCKEEVCISLEIRNSGERGGREVSQVYLDLSKVEGTPKRMLKGFQKTQLLEPGLFEEVVFQFRKRDLSTYSVEKADWVRAEFPIPAYIGSSSEDVRQKALIPYP